MNKQQFEQASQEITSLMQKPVCMMSGEELCLLTQYVHQSTTSSEMTSSAQGTANVIGVKALAVYLGCSESTIYTIKKQGILDKAIVAQIGRKIIFNAPLARELANAYQQEQRDLRRDSID